MITLVILVPATGGFHLFIRRPPDKIRRWADLVDLTTIAQVIRQEHPLVVGFIGTYTDLIAQQILPVADLICIPDVWLRDVGDDILALAVKAEQIADAHRQRPITDYVAAEYPGRETLPF